MHLHDPVELSEARIDRLCAEYEPGVCMNCGKQVGEDGLVCMTHDGPAICYACAGICDTCGGSGKICIGTSGQDADGNAPEFERCPECGYGEGA